MSELIQKHDNRATIRWKLLTGASALALTAYVSSASLARAGDASKPPIWIELDGQFSQQTNNLDIFVPPFLLTSPFDAASHVDLEKGPSKIWDKGAKISFQPDGSDWVLSLGVRYGKAARSETVNSLTAHPAGGTYGGYFAYQNFKAQSAEAHTIIDFQAGRDVGLGRFGSGGSSVLSGGVRIAQINSRNHAGIKSQPANIAYTYHRLYASFNEKRRFTGIGPSLSWDASANIAGNSSAGSLSLDWGVNGAVLFGRQRTQVHHQTTNFNVPYNTGTFYNRHHHPRIPVYQRSASPGRSKNVTVPNLGAFAGVSWRLPNARVTIGYRADMFFGPIDGGIDTAKKENRGFYGPFASISSGLGD